MLDSKISVLQHLIAQSQRQIDRLESLLETDDDAPSPEYVALDPKPTTAKEWPRKLPSPADDVDYRRRLSAAQVRLTQLLNEHMGISKG